MGFEANSLKVMARQPAILQGFMGLSAAILGPNASLDPVLRQMIAHISSAAAGCAYCQAHTAHGAEHRGADAEKLAALWSFETSDLFSPAEKAALDLALAAGSVPNQSTDAQFETLREHFSEDEIVEIVGVIALFGFLNRWNDTLATTLEDSPLAFAEAHLAPNGWVGERHKD
ncbi:MAG: carboxymuconolactone decarboxylase family protein [Henriciella sp.]|nr:carboxymuconolactone decarboxylase family protein [Henriciella sp.]